MTVTMDGNKTLTASFSGGGSDLPSECTGACNYGSTGIMYSAAINANMLPGDGHGLWQQLLVVAPACAQSRQRRCVHRLAADGRLGASYTLN